MARYQTNKALKRLAIVWCVIVGAATIQAVVFFGVPSQIMGSTLDMRYMLIFAALGLVGVILLTGAAYGHISAAWAIGLFFLPGGLALCWGQALLTAENFNLPTIAMFGLPIIAYTGGIVVSVYTTIIQLKLSRGSRGKHVAV